MLQVNGKNFLVMAKAMMAVGAAVGFMGCGGGGSSGGGGGSTTAPITSGGGNTGVVGPISGLAVNPGASQLELYSAGTAGTNEQFQLVIDGYDAQGNAKDLTRDVTYAISDDTVVQIDANGLLTAQAPGQATVDITFPGSSLATSIDVNVVASPANMTAPVFTALELLPKARTLYEVDMAAGVDQLQQTVIVGTDSNGRLWDLTRSNGVETMDYADPSLQPLPVSTAGQLDPNGLFRGIQDATDVLLVTKTTSGLVAGSHFHLGVGQSKPVSPGALFNGGPLTGSANPIDQAVLQVLQLNGISPAPLSTDGEFVRRAYADSIGRLPTPAETEAFLANPDRDALVDALVASPAFDAHMGKFFGEHFQMQDLAFDSWVASELAAGSTAQKIFTDLITQTGPGAAIFDTEHATAAEQVEEIVHVGSGYTIECDRCHDHPVASMADDPHALQTQRYQLDAFFVTDLDETIPLDRNANRTGNNGNRIEPGFPFDANVAVTTTLADDVATRRAEFAQIFTTSDIFFRGLSHRLFGSTVQTLMNPNQVLKATLDSVKNKPLLDALTATFKSQNASIKDFMTTVFKSKAYQLSSNYADTLNDELVVRHLVNRHHAEAMETLVANVTGSMPAQAAFFRDSFGFPLTRAAINERSTAVNMSQSLILMNSPVVHAGLTDPAGTVATLAADVAAANITQADAVNAIFKAGLSREADATDMQAANDLIGQAGSMEEGLQDVAAAVLSSIEAAAK